MGLIRQRKLLEHTTNVFDAENAYQATWNDPNTIEREKLLKDKNEIERFNRRQLLDGAQQTAAGQESERLATEAGDDRADEEEVKKTKKESTKD